MSEFAGPPKPDGRGRYARVTLAKLNLDIEAAAAGKTWLLLPEGYRAQDCGYTYPLPTDRRELQRVAEIYTPPDKADSGCVYIKRALAKWHQRQERQQSAIFDLGRRNVAIEGAQADYEKKIEELKAEATAAVEAVKIKADEAVASLNDLFSLGRRGLKGMMEAHLDNREWQGEAIDADAFRQCFRMVSQAVKGLGLPTEQRKVAEGTIMEEVAASLKASREALAMQATPQDDEDKGN